MAGTKKHPSELGFELAMKVQFDDSWTPRIYERHPELQTRENIVYVIIGVGKEYLRVGQAGKTLWQRWSRALTKQIPSTEGDPAYEKRGSEKNFRARWRSHPATREVEFWFKRARKIEFSYLGAESKEVSIREAEERYLDFYYEPPRELGIKLELRG